MRRSNTYAAVLLTTAMASTALAAACGSDGSEFGDGDAGGSSGSSGASGTSGTSGFNTSGGEGGGNDASFNPDAACATSTVTAKRAPANLLFIVDRSGSMNCNPPPTTTSAQCEQFPITADGTKPTKWSITRDALKGAIATMPASNSVGVTYFNVDDDCGVQTTPSVAMKSVDAAQLTLVNNSLNGVTPKGLTPIIGGVTLGYQYLHGQALTGKKFIVLLTDGAETCAESQQDSFVATTVKNAASVGIRTFVIGAPGSEDARAFLSQIAFNGLTARTATCTHAATPANVGDCHFDLTSATVNLATELNKALETISREALGCEYDVPSADGGVIDYDKVNVVYHPGAGGAAQTIPQDPTKACEGGANGWQYTPDKSKILLCGGACTTVKADQGGNVSVALGCATEVR